MRKIFDVISKLLLFKLLLMLCCGHVDNILRSELTNVKNYDPTTRAKKTILIGVLIPYTLGKKPLTSFRSGKYYASAMFLAIDEIKRSKMLETYDVQLIWENTECNITRTLQLQEKFTKLGVDVFIGGDCDDCEAAAKSAQQMNVPMVSYVSEVYSNQQY